MNANRLDSEDLLSLDFAHRAVVRVREARRRRQIRRRALTCAAAACCALVAFALLDLRPHTHPITRARPAIARENAELAPRWGGSTIEFATSTDSEALVVSEPLAFFFPGAADVADFQPSTTTYWHSYDPWWSPKQ